ncbi:DUF1758 domain-containing protein [Trichonephila clavipes]|nr:DUF1758 domain-containing protein [Trichonephila clavipes]
MQDDVCHIDRNVMTTLSMYVRNFKLTDLWSLESLGISNPTLEESKQNSYEDALNDFQQKLTILHNGRYELQLPWKHDPVNLPDNKGLTWARHEKVIKRAEIDFHMRILFSDEAHFWLNGYVNKQNCRIWREANPQVYVETPLHPEKLTVWCALWAGGILLQKR